MKIIENNISEEKKDLVYRPTCWEDFIGQQHIKSILKKAITSAIERNDSLGHILLAGDSGFGKTTIANIIASQLGKNLKIVTAYAIEKPADMLSILNQLEKGDILFIDEIHRLKPKIEEILYIAMEDFRVDIVMEEETLALPINKFTLIGATNKIEKLSDAFKNRFVYKFFLNPYSLNEIKIILKKYLLQEGISIDSDSLTILAKKTLPIPREIKNLAIRIRDYFIWAKEEKKITKKNVNQLIDSLHLSNFGLNRLQERYIELVKEYQPIGLKTLASMLNVNEKVIEKDIEPILLNLKIIEKTKKGRILNSNFYQ